MWPSDSGSGKSLVRKNVLDVYKSDARPKYFYTQSPPYLRCFRAVLIKKYKKGKKYIIYKYKYSYNKV